MWYCPGVWWDFEVCFVPVAIWISLFTNSSLIPYPRGADEGEPQGNGADHGKLQTMKMELVLCYKFDIYSLLRVKQKVLSFFISRKETVSLLRFFQESMD